VAEAGLLAIRAVVAGTFVVGFALVGNVARPRRFAGLFGAAPSIALANLIVLVVSEGDPKATRELAAMVYGAVGFVAYCGVERLLLPRIHAVAASAVSTAAWAAVSFAGYFWLLR
jgi:uncharacterized membrane protein (GlpM family)